MTETATPRETREFKTELKQLLHLITHSLYSHKEIFLRELISNASDAINKIKFDSLANDDKLEGNKDWKIRLVADKANNTLTISDNGIGMSRETIIENLGTIAKSGTKAFLDSLKQQEVKTRPDLIGQFGVGFYSAFMVADKVTVYSRTFGTAADGVRWESDGQGEFVVEPQAKANRGTDVVLHLKEESREFLDEWQLRTLVKKFSDFIEHPVVIDVEQKEGEQTIIKEEVLNSRKAIWLRSRSEVTQEEYNAFYQQISNDMEPPAKVIHYNTEGKLEFRALLFIPSKKPFSYQWEEPKGVRLYVQRVLIMDACEGLLPAYLRFVRGVVDSSDLPLNISRELLQQNAILEKMQKNIVNNILEALEGMKNVDYDQYVSFFREFGVMIKEGIGRDWSNRERLADLVLFESVKTEKGKYTTLASYLEKMPAEQKEIYYLSGDSRELIEHSPLLESFRAKDWDVLLLSEPIDEFMLPSLNEYKGKSLKAVDRGDLDADADKPLPGSETFQELFAFLKTRIPEVGDVRLSRRLKESAACLVADSGAMGAHYEHLLQRMGKADEMQESKRILELNGEHPTVVALREVYQKDASDRRVESFGRLLYEQAVIAEGSKLKDPVGFAHRINELITTNLK